MSNRSPYCPTFALAKREESIYGLQSDTMAGDTGGVVGLKSDLQIDPPRYQPTTLQHITQGCECFIHGCESFITRVLMIYTS